MTLDLDALEAVARAATPDGELGSYTFAGVGKLQQFQSKVSPNTVLALITRLREAEALNDAARAVHHPVEALNTRYGRRQQVCAGCGTDDGNWMVWPCPTTRALTKAEGSTER